MRTLPPLNLPAITSNFYVVKNYRKPLSYLKSLWLMSRRQKLSLWLKFCQLFQVLSGKFRDSKLNSVS